MYRFTKIGMLIYFKVVLLNILIVVLFPLVVIQAMWVRKKTLRLPEASGNRKITSLESGETPDSSSDDASDDAPIFKVLILGDSAAAGVGAKKQEHALLGQLHHRIGSMALSHLSPLSHPAHLPRSDNVAVSSRLLAQTGFTSGDVLQTLKSQQVEALSVALVSVGVNDVTRFTSIMQWQRNIQALIDTLTNTFKCQLIIFTALPPMHLFPAIPQPLRSILGARARILNQVMSEQLQCNENTALLFVSSVGDDVSMKEMFDSGLMAHDGFHPSEKGYALWADEAVHLIERITQKINRL